MRPLAGWTGSPTDANDTPSGDPLTVLSADRQGGVPPATRSPV